MTGLFTPPGHQEDGAAIGYAPLGGMVIDATGHITYDFAGHIHATGIDLDASTVVLPDPDDKIRWLSPIDAHLVAQIYGFTGGLDSLEIGIGDPFTSGSTRTLLDGSGVSGVAKSDFLQITASGSNPLRSVARKVTLTWPGGTPFSNNFNLLGLLGYAPTGVIGTASGGFNVLAYYDPATGQLYGTAFTGAGVPTSPVAGTTNDLSIIAWG